MKKACGQASTACGRGREVGGTPTGAHAWHHPAAAPPPTPPPTPPTHPPTTPTTPPAHLRAHGALHQQAQRGPLLHARQQSAQLHRRVADPHEGDVAGGHKSLLRGQGKGAHGLQLNYICNAYVVEGPARITRSFDAARTPCR